MKEQILTSNVVEEETVWAQVVRNMQGRQKTLFKCMLQLGDEATKDEKSLLEEAIYREGLKL